MSYTCKNCLRLYTIDATDYANDDYSLEYCYRCFENMRYDSQIVCSFCEDTFPEEDICDGNCPTCNKTIEPPDNRVFAQKWLDWMHSQKQSNPRKHSEALGSIASD